MIDTIRLQFENVKVTDELSKKMKITVMKEDGNEIKTELFETESEIIYGKKAYYNWKGISFDVDSKYRTGSEYVMPKGSVRLSLPKLIGKDYTSNLNKDDIIIALKKLQEELDKIGIITNVWKAKIVEMHLFFDLPVDYDFEKYFPVLLQLEDFKIKHKKRFPTTVYFGNGSNELCIYSKRDEYLNRNRLAKYRCEMLRFEDRLKTARSVLEFAKVNSIEGFVYKYDDIRKLFYATLLKKIKLIEINYNDITTPLGIYNIIQRNNETKKNWLDNSIKQIGHIAIQSVIDHRNFIEMLKNIKPYFNPSKLYKNLKPYISFSLFNDDLKDVDYSELKKNLEETLIDNFHYRMIGLTGQI